MRAWKVVLFAVMASVVGAMPATTALAGTMHRAAVIVDTGDNVTTAYVEFSEDSISGLELLQRAGFSPETYGFSGLGAAVCRMAGKGCEVGQSCLTCDSGNYWSYSRAPSGSNSFTSSRVGASSARVADGDIDGWKYGTGGAPPFQVLFPSPEPAPEPAPAPAPVSVPVSAPGPAGAPPASAIASAALPSTSPGVAADSSSSRGAASAPSAPQAAPTGAPSSTVEATASSSRASNDALGTTPAGATRRDGTHAAAARATHTRSSSGGGAIGVAGVLVGLGALGVWVEHRRRVVRSAKAP